MNPKYVEGDFPSLVQRLENHFSRVRASWNQARWQGALVLGGGYGRGEGGVMVTPDGPQFSNDLDYFLFHDEPSTAGLSDWCRQIEHSESRQLGIDVEIKVLKKDEIGDPAASMMFSDLIAGHVVVTGDAAFLTDRVAHLDFGKIGAAEASRLLWNRGSGLYFAKCRLRGQREKAFVIRNHAKMKLALGDGWLCLRGDYVPWCRERGLRLAKLDLPEDLTWLGRWHAEGVEFKLRPFSDGVSWTELAEESEALIRAWGQVFLRVESARLSRNFQDFGSYLKVNRLMPDKPLVKNLALSLRDIWKRGGCLRPVMDYPRAALMRVLPCLLEIKPAGLPNASRFLPAPGGDRPAPENWETTYARWWAFYA